MSRTRAKTRQPLQKGNDDLRSPPQGEQGRAEAPLSWSEERFRGLAESLAKVASFPLLNPNPIVEADLAGKHEISTRFVPESDVPSLLEQTLAAAIEMTGADMGHIQFLDGSSGRLNIVAHRGFEPPFLDFFRQVQAGSGSGGTAMLRAERTIVEDVAQHPELFAQPTLDILLGAGVRAFQSTPLCAWSGRLLGMLTTYSRTRRRPLDRDLRLLDLLARQLADSVERSQAEEALRRAKEEWERTFDTVPDLIAILDREHRIVRANRAMMERLGKPLEECLGHVCYQCVHGTDRPPACCPHVLTLADGQEHTAEVHDPQLGGDFLVSTTPLRDAQGRQVGSVHVARDITERKLAEDRGRLLAEVTSQLLASDQPQRVVESLCRKITGHLGCHVFCNYLVDEASGRLHLNACAGIPDDTARRIEWLDFGAAVCGCVARDGGPIVVERVQTALDPRAELIRSLGIQAYACHPLLNQGRVIGTLSFGSRTKTSFGQDELELMRTVADQVAIAMQRIHLLEVSQQHAQAAEAANAAKDQFLANVSHELRTPMAAILGMTNLALGTELHPTVRDYLETAKESADGLMQLLNQILDFSRIEAGGFQLEVVPFHLRATLDQTLKTLSVRAYEKGLELVCELPDELPDRLIGDPLRLRQILTNLIGNAIKFTDRGEVVVHVTNLPLPTEHCEGDTAEVLLEFAVRDTGMGISPADQQRIFAPFTQVDASTTRQFGGTGLGLAIASSLVHLMGGRIWVESELGRGSTFHFTARLQLESGVHPQAGAEPLPPDQLRGMPVLVVDDNPGNRRVLADMLSDWSMKPELAEHAPAALAKIQQSLAAGQHFPLMIIDALMPDIDGLTLIQWIKADPRLAGAVILMLSSANQSILAERLRPLHVAAFLEKPVSRDALFQALTRSLGIAARDEPPAAAAAPGDGGRPPSRPLRVLLAEDTVANQKLVLAVLSERGHTVHIAPHGRAALELIQQQDFDLALMDVSMPFLDGFQTTAAIRALQDPAKARLPIVAMTAHAMVGDRQRCLAAGMDAYLTKPITSQELIAAVERLACGAEPPQASQTSASPGRLEPAVEAFDGEAALASLGGRANLLQEMVGFFLKDAPGCVAEIQAGLRDRAPSTIAQAAHRLKGTLLYLGAKPALQAAQFVEQIGDSRDLPQAASTIRVLTKEIERLEAAVRSWQERLPAKGPPAGEALEAITQRSGGVRA